MGARVEATAGGSLVVAFVAGAVLVILALALAVPLDSLAVPTPLCVGEIAAVSSLFLVYAAVARPAKDALDRSMPSISKLMRLKVEPPGLARTAALALFIFGSFFFAFWAAADVLGGYKGYGYSFSAYPVLPGIYNHSIGLIPYISSHDQGTQAAFYMGLAILGLVVYKLNRGFGAALKDAVTLFVAPCLVVFELALWSQAPQDMTWHVTDFLWIGGIADGGFRQRDFKLLPYSIYPAVPGGFFVGPYVSGPYVFSNWFVLAVALLLVASRVPWVSLFSTMLWRRKRAELQKGNGSVQVARWAERASDRGPAGRTISALGAFEPTTLRFLWPE